jgi:hypothetical protein
MLLVLCLLAVCGAVVFGVVLVRSDGSAGEEWRVVFDGYGEGFVQSGTNASPRFALVPNSADGASRTHAVLVVGRDDSDDFELQTRMRTFQQLRIGSAPNPWEVAWLVWRYRDPEHFYYLALKPNGWELGKRDPAYEGGQRFLATGDEPRFAVGEDWHAIVVRTDGPVMTVTVDGTELARFEDGERPLLRGKVGMYTEDARVEFGAFALTPRP